MIDIDGEALIKRVCQELRRENRQCYDCSIVSKLRSFNVNDLKMIIAGSNQPNQRTKTKGN